MTNGGSFDANDRRVLRCQEVLEIFGDRDHYF